MLRIARGSESLKITLAPEFQFRHEHVDYEQLERLADETMEASEREILEVHLKVCATCLGDIHRFLAFREQLEKEIKPSVTVVPKSTRRACLGSLGGVVWHGNLLTPQQSYSLESR
ncbi:MAG: hypothetical protein ABR555_12475 [Pyrinomonadaceae bacterium]